MIASDPMHSIPSEPREMWVIGKARQFIQEANIRWLPVQPIKVAKQFGWQVYRVGQIAWRTGLPRHRIINGNDSDVYYCNGKYKIVYNENAYPRRIRYTIAHEIGHIVLGHLEEFEQTRLSRGGLTDEEYYVLDREAEIFAAELLMPLPILRALKLASAQDIMRVCDVSRSAANTRVKELRRSFAGDSFDMDDVLIEQFSSFLNQLDKPNLVDKQSASIVRVGYSSTKAAEEVAVYQIGEDARMGLITEENDRLSACPSCGNRNFSQEASYCRYCGTFLYNQCLNEKCKHNNPPDARYCEMCGEETYLFKQGFLEPYQVQAKTKPAGARVVQLKGQPKAPEPEEDFEDIPVDDVPF